MQRRKPCVVRDWLNERLVFAKISSDEMKSFNRDNARGKSNAKRSERGRGLAIKSVNDSVRLLANAVAALLVARLIVALQTRDGPARLLHAEDRTRGKWKTRQAVKTSNFAEIGGVRSVRISIWMF